jgi:hypothetical protein
MAHTQSICPMEHLQSRETFPQRKTEHTPERHDFFFWHETVRFFSSLFVCPCCCILTITVMMGHYHSKTRVLEFIIFGYAALDITVASEM